MKRIGTIDVSITEAIIVGRRRRHGSNEEETGYGDGDGSGGGSVEVLN